MERSPYLQPGFLVAAATALSAVSVGSYVLGCKSTCQMNSTQDHTTTNQMTDLKHSSLPSNISATTTNCNDSTVEHELKLEQLSRNRQMFGHDAQTRIEKSFVIVVGAGGVGSHAAHMLARSGVGRIRIIDFDNVTLSSLNRHSVATRTDVGTPKVDAFKRHIAKIAPFCEIEAIVSLFEASNCETLLNGHPDYVLDCIDDAQTKTALLQYCRTHKIPVLSSLGAGGKTDPTQLRFGYLSDVVTDPLSTKIRYLLRNDEPLLNETKNTEISTNQTDTDPSIKEQTKNNKQENTSKSTEMNQTDTSNAQLSTPRWGPLDDDPAKDILTVYSAEKPSVKLLPLSDEQEDAPHEYGALPNFRVRVMPVLGTLPAMFGMAMASFTLCQLGDKSFTPEELPRMSRKVLLNMKGALHNRHTVWYGPEAGEVDMTVEEAEFIVQYVWRQRSGISGDRIGTGKKRMVLARWDPSKPTQLDNIIVVSAAENERLLKEGIDWVPQERRNFIESRLQWARETFWGQYNVPQ